MNPRVRIAWITGFAILTSLLYLRTATAQMPPADSYGRILVPALQPLGQAITHDDTPVYCSPTDPDAYGWISDRDQPLDITEVSDDDGATWHIDWANVSINISGDICSQLERLTRYPETRSIFDQKLPTPRPVKKGHKPKQERFDVWPNQNTIQAAIALLTLGHEAEHVALQTTDEGLAECSAFQNRWPLVATLHLPARLAQLVLGNEADNHYSSPPEELTQC